MHPSTESILKHFSYQHLPPKLAEFSKPLCELAHSMAAQLEGPELTAGLRKLLEAKDCLVRAALESRHACDPTVGNLPRNSGDSPIDTELLILAAKTAHEVNRAYCQGLGDTSQLPWEQAPEWQRSSSREGVEGVLAGNTPRELHNSWLARKLADGWKQGTVKDPERKEHPCCVLYDDLPASQKVKDALFLNTARGVLSHHGVVVMISRE